MSKRVADTYITDQNWDIDNQKEDEGPGEFRKADEAVLKNRVIRKAKRRVAPGQGGASAFSGFSGLKALGNNRNSDLAGGFRGFNLPKNGANITSAFQSGVFQTKSDSTLMPKASAVSYQASNEGEAMPTTKEYNRHLSALNRSVSDWIKNHVEKNPLCDLTPIFTDYKKYLADIDENFGQSDSEASQTSTHTTDLEEDVSKIPDTSEFKLKAFGSNPQMTTTAKQPENTVAVTKPLFAGFSTGAVTASPFKGFNIPSKGPVFPGISFSATTSTGDAAQKDNQQSQESEEYVPPKPESNIVVEDDAFFTIRCKLYYKKGDSYADRGVGQLYLKPSGTKTQLLIRADTTISQVLLNVLLAPSIPIKKQGKNNVLIMCIANPPLDEKSSDEVSTMLIRVKTSEDADKLLEIMEKKKKEEAASAES